MELFKKTLFHLIIFAILGLIICAVVVDYYNLGIFSFIYFVVIYALVVLAYYYINKKTKAFTKKRNKIIFFIPIVIASIVLFGAILGTVDYIMVKNGKAPIFTLASYGYSKDEFFEKNDKNSYSSLRYTANEYYGLGYKLVVCDSCEKSVYFMPLGLGTYAWSKGVPIDKLDGLWFHARNNDIYLSFDGVGNYSLLMYGETAEKGTYTVDDNSAIITPSNGDDIGNCTIENNYHQLHCDKYAVVFMK